MKNFLKFVAAFAALAAVSPAFAQTNQARNWELASRPAPGPSRSGLAASVWVPVKNAASAMANCDCAMMKASAADPMMGMPSKHSPHSKV